MSKKPRYYLHKAVIYHKEKVVRVIKVIKEGNNPRFLKQVSERPVKTIPLDREIPMEVFKVTYTRFDGSAIQSDDRFFERERTAKRYSPEVCKEIMEKALEGYNTEPKRMKDRSFDELMLKAQSRGYVEIMLYMEKGITKPFEKSIDMLTAFSCSLSIKRLYKELENKKMNEYEN